MPTKSVRLLLCVSLLFCGFSWAATSTVQAVAVLSTPSGVVVKIALTGPVTPQGRAMTSPDRIVLD
ncbi:MAG: hypothetical protein H0X25_06050, partial [Acidobacteriales bacterium]|nr:hypothetical protein [Terriglobales bacterium]